MSLERDILKRFKKGNFIRNKEEEKVLMKYADWISFGFNYKEKKADACLTEQGRWLFSQMY